MFVKALGRVLNEYELLPRHFMCLKYQIRHSSSSNSYIIKSSYPDVKLPNIPLHQYVWQNINKWPDHVAIECGVSGKKYTYKELFKKCKRFATSLKRFGLKKGDTIAIFLPNIPEFPIAYLGSVEIGLVVSTVNPGYTKDEVGYQLKDSNAKWIICHPNNLQIAKEVKKSMRNIKIICTHNIDGTSPGTDEGLVLFEEMISDSVDYSSLGEEDIDTTATAVIAYSSGTTGLPKGTCLTHDSLNANLAQSGPASGVCKFVETHGDHQDVIPAVLPFFHLYGNAVVLLQGLTHGSKLITLPKFEPSSYLSVLKNNYNMLLKVAPPIVFFLGNSAEVNEKHVRGIREMMSAAAPCSAHDIMKIKQKAKHTVLFSQGYGLTEASPILTLYTPDGTENDNTSTIGKLVPNTSAKVLSLENNEVLPPNTTGELCFKGPQIMKGYLNNPTATANTIDAEGWIHTGDVGYFDNDGYFYITDRIKELIKVKGFQVAPAELEEVIRKYPGVLEAGVVGVACKRTGETPVAFVQTTPDAKISEQDIKSFVASQLSKHKHVTSVKFISSIPKTASGKILRRQLKQLV